ncbi:hypothetical protein Plhal304r1_c006g0024041 [Plasmopara halstedii]
MAGSNQWLGEFSGGGGRRGEPQPQIRPQSLKVRPQSLHDHTTWTIGPPMGSYLVQCGHPQAF